MRYAAAEKALRSLKRKAPTRLEVVAQAVGDARRLQANSPNATSDYVASRHSQAK